MIGRAVGQAFRLWWLAFALYLPGLAIGALTTVAPAAGLNALTPLGPWVERVASGGYPGVLAEAGGALAAGGTQPPPAVAAAGLAFLAGLLLLIAGSVIQWAAYTIVAGGLLERLSGGGTFRHGCREWLWPMVRCSLIGGFLFCWLALVGLVPVVAIPAWGPAALLAKLAGWLLWLELAGGLVELIRAAVVVEGDRRVLRVTGRTMAWLWHPPFLARALATWLLLGMVGLAFGAAQLALISAIPATSLAISFAVAQLALFAGAWLKLLRLGVAIELARTRAVHPAAIAPAVHPATIAPAGQERYTVQEPGRPGLVGCRELQGE